MCAKIKLVEIGALLMAGMGHMPYPDVPAFVAEAAGLMADPEGPR